MAKRRARRTRYAGTQAKNLSVMAAGTVLAAKGHSRVGRAGGYGLMTVGAHNFSSAKSRNQKLKRRSLSTAQRRQRKNAARAPRRRR